MMMVVRVGQSYHLHLLGFEGEYQFKECELEGILDYGMMV